ncbi:hypothetical protein IFR05_001114 [Cadophora sp. M221]|nr:hypothetical protein IFR05_001114 [Cadophora sp. M221]
MQIFKVILLAIAVSTTAATVAQTSTDTLPAVLPKRHDSGKTIPAYATACSGSARYSSACSCWGITVEPRPFQADTTVTVPVGMKCTEAPGTSTCAGRSCLCASITDLTGFCVSGDTPCDGLADCTASDDCALGSVCAVSSCCVRNVCIASDACGGASVPKFMFGRDLRKATIGHTGFLG